MSSLIKKIKSEISSRPKVWRNIANFVLNSEDQLLGMKLKDLSFALGVSDGSIINFVRSLGYPGFVEFKVALAQSRGGVNESYASAGGSLSTIIDSAHDALDSAAELDSNLLPDMARALINCCGSVIIIGKDTSYYIAEILAGYLTRIGISAFAANEPISTARALRRADVMIAVSYSGETEQICSSACIAKERGAFVAAITSFSESTLAKGADIVLSTKLREASEGEFPLVARIVELALIDALCSTVIAMKKDDKQ